MSDNVLLTDVLGLFHEEELIRFQRRAEKRDLKAAAERFSTELDMRKERDREHKKKKSK